MKNKSKDLFNNVDPLFNNDIEINVGEEDLILMPPTALFDEKKTIARNTKFDERYSFSLQYDTNQKGFLLSMLQTTGAIVKGNNEEGHALATSMNILHAHIFADNDIAKMLFFNVTSPFCSFDTIIVYREFQEHTRLFCKRFVLI